MIYINVFSQNWNCIVIILTKKVYIYQYFVKDFAFFLQKLLISRWGNRFLHTNLGSWTPKFQISDNQIPYFSITGFIFFKYINICQIIFGIFIKYEHSEVEKWFLNTNLRFSSTNYKIITIKLKCFTKKAFILSININISLLILRFSPKGLILRWENSIFAQKYPFLIQKLKFTTIKFQIFLLLALFSPYIYQYFSDCFPVVHQIWPFWNKTIDLWRKISVLINKLQNYNSEIPMFY